MSQEYEAKSVHFCTIVARNYLAHARVLGESLQLHEPKSRFTVLVLDEGPAERLTSNDAFEVLHPADLPFAPGEFEAMRAVYDVTELATAVKPTVLQHLRTESDVVAYLDPDIKFFAPLPQLHSAGRQHSIVLTPHAVEPYPRDGLFVDEGTIMRAGVFNLGFIAVSEGSEAFLAWWRERLRWDALIAPEQGLFTDQRWIDAVPALFDVFVQRDKGWNVAYWNLHERPLNRSGDGELRAGDHQLRFFHFSGYDPKNPLAVSKHQGSRPRITLRDNPVLEQELATYAEDLTRHGHPETSKISYRWAAIDGDVLPRFVRRVMRESLISDSRDPSPDPFAEGGGEALRAWLLEPVARRGRTQLPRILFGLWRQRPDLQAHFPDILRSDLKPAIHAANHAVAAGTESELAPFWSPSATRARLPVGSNPGITVVGYFRAELGVGEAGRLTLLAAEQVGLPVSSINVDQTDSRQQHEFVDRPGRIRDLCITCVNADQTTAFLNQAGNALSAAKHKVGLWFWETSEFPQEFSETADQLDELWVASEFVRDAVSRVVDTPVRMFPLPIVPDAPTALTRSDLGLPDDRWLAAYAFDLFSVWKRKNPEAVLAAFTRAFSVDDGAFLLVKINNGWADRSRVEKLRSLSGYRPDIRIVDDIWPARHMQALYQLIDCYVSLHRSEGFGLTIAQAMAQGKPVVATSYSGNLTFMSPENSLLVPTSPVLIGDDAAPYGPDGHWAEPDVDQAAEFLAQLKADPAMADAIGRAAAKHIRERHSLASAADFLRTAVLTVNNTAGSRV